MRPLPDIRKTVVLRAPIEKVWRAVATSDGLAAWWMPNDFQPILGHQFVIHAGPYGDSLCRVTELDPPHRLSFAWGPDWHLAFELRDIDGQTELTLVHSGWDADKFAGFDLPHAQARSTMDNGWEKLTAFRLRAYVEAQ